jgi:hypothetical protein
MRNNRHFDVFDGFDNAIDWSAVTGFESMLETIKSSQKSSALDDLLRNVRDEASKSGLPAFANVLATGNDGAGGARYHGVTNEIPQPAAPDDSTPPPNSNAIVQAWLDLIL